MVILLVVILAGPTLGRTAVRIAKTDNKSAAEFAALIDRNVPASAAVLNWEFEVEFYSHHTFVHPPETRFAASIDREYNHKYANIPDQRGSDLDAEYVVVGPFAQGTGVFQSELTNGKYKRVASVDVYELYRRGE